MTLSRQQLLNSLEAVSPALSDNELLPVMTHFWFTGSGNRVMAFNDKIAVSVPLESGFEGAVPGRQMLSLLKAMEAKEVDLQPNGTAIGVKAKGRNSRFQLATMEPETFESILTQMPEMPCEVAKLGVDPTVFLEGIENCLLSVGNDPSVPDQLGITLIAGSATIEMFSTNSSTLSYSRVPIKGKAGFKRATLPTSFCQQMLKLLSKPKELRLEITEQYALLDAGNDRFLFGRLVETDGRLPFVDVLNHHLPADRRGDLVTMPNLGSALDKAIILTENIADGGKTTFTVADVKTSDGMARRLRVFYESAKGDGTDSIKLDPHHPEVSSRVDPKLLKIGQGEFPPGKSQFLVTASCVVMAKGDDQSMMYLVASRTSE